MDGLRVGGRWAGVLALLLLAGVLLGSPQLRVGSWGTAYGRRGSPQPPAAQGLPPLPQARRRGARPCKELNGAVLHGPLRRKGMGGSTSESGRRARPHRPLTKGAQDSGATTLRLTGSDTSTSEDSEAVVDPPEV